MGDWAALDKMLNAEADAPPPTSYGRDAPVKASGITPAAIGPAKVEGRTASRKPAPAPAPAPRDGGAIWDADEVRDDDADDPHDTRPEPEHSVCYKQRVSPEDMFLGIDPLRHAGTACSDAIVLKVRVSHETRALPALRTPTHPRRYHKHPATPSGPRPLADIVLTRAPPHAARQVELPGTRLDQVDLDVRPTFAKVSAPKFKLRVHLPEKVDEKRRESPRAPDHPAPAPRVRGAC